MAVPISRASVSVNRVGAPASMRICPDNSRAMRIWLLERALRLDMFLSLALLSFCALGTRRCTSNTSAITAVAPVPLSVEGVSLPQGGGFRISGGQHRDLHDVSGLAGIAHNGESTALQPGFGLCAQPENAVGVVAHIYVDSVRNCIIVRCFLQLARTQHFQLVRVSGLTHTGCKRHKAHAKQQCNKNHFFQSHKENLDPCRHKRGWY